jgi:hypothetical protein
MAADRLNSNLSQIHTCVASTETTTAQHTVLGLDVQNQACRISGDRKLVQNKFTPRRPLLQSYGPDKADAAGESASLAKAGDFLTQIWDSEPPRNRHTINLRAKRIR